MTYRNYTKSRYNYEMKLQFNIYSSNKLDIGRFRNHQDTEKMLDICLIILRLWERNLFCAF